MAILVTGNTFATGDNVTAATLNAAVNSATFATGAVDNATTQISGGAIIVKDGGITPAKLSTGGPSWTAGAVFTTSGFLAGKTTAGAGVVHVADEGANTYNALYSRNNANGAYIDLTYRATAHDFAGTGAAWITADDTGLTIASGLSLVLGNAYAAGAPTATGYLVVKDSTGTAYKIPAVAV